ncbi:hypothetical protein B0H11DRAFT_1911610 [Mycena galericulata]|nr:hypothetical protein B0H11DRAFT_1911610 [Mycena galericulata]
MVTIWSTWLCCDSRAFNLTVVHCQDMFKLKICNVHQPGFDAETILNALLVNLWDKIFVLRSGLGVRCKISVSARYQHGFKLKCTTFIRLHWTPRLSSTWTKAGNGTIFREINSRFSWSSPGSLPLEAASSSTRTGSVGLEPRRFSATSWLKRFEVSQLSCLARILLDSFELADTIRLDSDSDSRSLAMFACSVPSVAQLDVTYADFGMWAHAPEFPSARFNNRQEGWLSKIRRNDNLGSPNENCTRTSAGSWSVSGVLRDEK